MTGQPYISPVHEVKRLAREVGMEGKVRIINFGVRSQGSEVRQALDDCIHSGNWLLLQNYHLADQPDPPFFTMLKVGSTTDRKQAPATKQQTSKQSSAAQRTSACVKGSERVPSFGHPNQDSMNLCTV